MQLELNQVVRDNQTAYLPVVRSGRAEALLFDRYPELAEKIDQNKRAKVEAIILSNKHGVSDQPSTSFRAQSLEDATPSPRQRHRRRASKDGKSPAVRPDLKGQISSQDLMFDMSDEEGEQGGFRRKAHLFAEQNVDQDTVETPLGSLQAPCTPVRRQSRSTPHVDTGSEDTVSKSTDLPGSPLTPDMRPSGQPWGSTPLISTKLDLKDIMAQASSNKKSNLTLGLSREDKESISKSPHTKMSQKERKRLQQAQQLGTTAEKPQAQATPPAVSPWQGVSRQKTNDSIVTTPAMPPTSKTPPQPARISSTPQLTMRQTIANRSASQNQKEDQATTQAPKAAARSTASPTKRPGPNDKGMSVSTDPIPTPRSVRHIPLPQHSPTSPSQHLSMMEILSLQEAEKTSIRDAAAKRSLQEIQQEQEFQQWWDQESQRVMREEEQQRRAAERAARNATRGKERGRGGRASKPRSRKEGEEEKKGKGSRDVSVGPDAAGDAKGGKAASKEAGTGAGPCGRERGGRRRGRGGGGGGGPRGGARGGARGGRNQAQDQNQGQDASAVAQASVSSPPAP